ncbi:uncharacterized protein LOC103576296 [Microplitis demolitor]|uniref:uncharacterized protein LOC103576296 n=1 Tax=Microplitis demolitor TaxID=69319 RepID=UPI00235B6E01|nr:uncharacterized protein LOC103576296 [Microplitis demolitor]
MRLSTINTIEDLQTILQLEAYANIGLNNFSRTDIQFVTNTTNEIIAIMFRDQELQRKVTTSKLYITSSAIVPENVGALQIITIATHHSEYIMPIIYLIMLRKNEGDVQRALEDGLRNLQPEEIYTDLDRDIHLAASAVCPNAIKRGLFTSQCKIFIKEATNYNIDLNNDTTLLIFNKIIALSLLPSTLILESFEWIVSSMDDIRFNQFSRFLEYYRTNWLSRITANNYSCFNNIYCLLINSELIARDISNHLHEDKNIWSFVEEEENNIENVEEEENNNENVEEEENNVENVEEENNIENMEGENNDENVEEEENNIENVEEEENNIDNMEEGENNIENVEQILWVSDECGFCLVVAPTIVYKPCNHVIACKKCNTTWVQRNIIDGTIYE